MQHYEEVKVEHYDNGNKMREMYYKDGKQNGIQTEWNEDGTKVGELHFKDGVKISK
jgi:antitoxin component YwqK of YwqJK toxin-antitoxin module